MTKKDIPKKRPMLSNRLREGTIACVKIAAAKEDRYSYEILEDAISMYIEKKHPDLRVLLNAHKSNK